MHFFEIEISFSRTRIQIINCTKVHSGNPHINVTININMYIIYINNKTSFLRIQYIIDRCIDNMRQFCMSRDNTVINVRYMYHDLHETVHQSLLIISPQPLMCRIMKTVFCLVPYRTKANASFPAVSDNLRRCLPTGALALWYDCTSCLH